MSFQSAEGSPLINGFGNTPTLAGSNDFTGANQFTDSIQVTSLIPSEIVDSTSNIGADGYVLTVSGSAGALLWAPGSGGGGGDVTESGNNDFTGTNTFAGDTQTATLFPAKIVDSMDSSGIAGQVLSVTGGSGALLWTAGGGGGGGDVTAVGDNAFTGSNSFSQEIIALGGMDATGAAVACGTITGTTLTASGLVTCSAGLTSVAGVSTFSATTCGQLTPGTIRDTALSTGAAGYLLTAGAAGNALAWIAPVVGNLATVNTWALLNTFTTGINIPGIFAAAATGLVMSIPLNATYDYATVNEEAIGYQSVSYDQSVPFQTIDKFQNIAQFLVPVSGIWAFTLSAEAFQGDLSLSTVSETKNVACSQYLPTQAYYSATLNYIVYLEEGQTMYAVYGTSGQYCNDVSLTSVRIA